MTDIPDRTQELIGLEERFWLEGGGNPDFWQDHFADDGVVALPFGVMDKDATVQAMGSAEPWTRVDMHELRVVPLGDASTLVVYRATARRAADEQDFEAVVGSVYVKRDEAWYLAFHQQSFPVVDPNA